MSDAFASVGTVLKIGNGGTSAEVFTAIAEIIDINGPNYTRETIDVTNLDSSGGYREFIAGFRDGGEVSCTGNFTLAGFDDLMDVYEAQSTERNFQLILADTGETTIEFAAWVTSISVAARNGQQVTMDFTLKVTGAPTLTT